MPNFKHILFPVDFSQQCCNVAPYVLCMARRYGALVTMLHVMELPTGAYPGWPAQAAVIDFEAMAEDRKKRLDSYLKNEFAEVAQTRLMREGDPAHMITEYAQKEHVDLVMMPTHGYGPFRRFLLGSVTAKVLHDVHAPVWTAAHAEKQHAAPMPRKILCALDGSDKSPALARWAFEFSREFGASLQLLHVVRTVSDWLGLESEQALQEELRAESRQRIERKLESAGLQLPLRVAVGEIVDAITEEARQESADLVVLGRGAAHETLGRLRTHAHGIIQRSPCPVVSV